MSVGEASGDFRSDTVTRPSPGMLAAMAAAEVGDDVLDGDPTVARLEAWAADWLGKDGALFVPSGTMANQCALGAWTRPGDEVVAEASAHVVQWEGGALAALHGVQSATVRADDGRMDPDEVEALFRIDSIHCPRTALLCVEQTFMGTGVTVGGHVLPLAHLAELRARAERRGIPVHMDGARLGNAVVASGHAAAELAACADSVSICLSKGLGAPVGSLIAGPAEFLERAKAVRKRLGGWMRQAGYLAAAGLYALEHQLADLEHDHALARRVAEVLDARPELHCPPSEVETNIASARVEPPDLDAPEVARRLGAHGIRVLPLSPRSVRFCTHRDLGEPDLELLARAVERAFSS